ncbi:MAG: hypothetical protein DMG39_14160 [Acidobacteria bacterium]|nr:MAG: hypothetical protein DMG39_14160 [Acidobacteriota bacterium]
MYLPHPLDTFELGQRAIEGAFEGRSRVAEFSRRSSVQDQLGHRDAELGVTKAESTRDLKIKKERYGTP